AGRCGGAAWGAAEAPGVSASERRGVASFASPTAAARQPVRAATTGAKPTRSLPMTTPEDAPVAKLRRARSVHERNTVDLPQRRLRCLRLCERRLPERDHPFAHRGRLQIGGGLAVEDHLAYRRRKVEQLGDR